MRAAFTRGAAIALLAMGVAPLANWLTDGRAIPWYDAAMREWAVRGLLLLALATLASWRFGPAVDRALDGARRLLLRPSPAAFSLVLALAAFLLAVMASHLAFAAQPFTSDEMAQEWHARILASGHLFARAEASREFFNTAPVWDASGRWFSQYPVGGPALLALGVLVGAPWLVNPLLLSVAVCAYYGFLARAGDELTARGAALLLVTSPMVLVMAGSQMNHVAVLALTTVALWSAVRWDAAERAPERFTWAVATGACVGLAGLTRPLDAAVVALVVGGAQALRAVRQRDRWGSLAVEALAAAVPVAVLLWTNAQTTGSPLLFGYDALNGPEHRLGFHVDPNGEAHTPLRGLTLASSYLMRLSLFLFEWPIPGVLAIAAGLVALRKPTRWDVALAALALGIVAAYGLYWFDGFFAGPRFLFTAVPAFAYFAARLPALPGASHTTARRAAALLLPPCVLVAWLVPGVSSASSRIAVYREQRTKLKTDVEEQMRRERLPRALVFVNEGWRGRLQARLRVLGASQFRAERVLNAVDACALQSALDAADGSPGPDSMRLARVLARARAFGVPRPVPGLQADQAIALVPGSSPTPACLAEAQRDTIGTIPYPLFLARQRVGRDGRIGGQVVWARDLGPRNELLRARFPDRAWFRYRPLRSFADTAPVFLKY